MTAELYDIRALKFRLNISTDIDIDIRQDPEWRAAFDFWVRNVYLDRPSAPPAQTPNIRPKMEMTIVWPKQGA